MGITTLKGEKGEIRLRKSQRLVGLRLRQSRSIGLPDFVRQEVFPNLGGFTLVELDTSKTPLDEKLDEIRQLGEVELGTHAYFPEGSNRPLVPNGFIFITFEEGVSEEEQQIVLDEFSLDLIERRPPDTLLVKVTAQSPNPVKTAALAQASCLVRLAEPDWDTVLDEYNSIPRDPLFPHQWHLQNNGFLPDSPARLTRGADIRVLNAWQQLVGITPAPVTIAVIDTGFDLAHPDFQGKIFRPFDLHTRSSALVQGNPNAHHGTPCASLAIAGANGTGMVGVAPGARFMPFNGLSFSDVDTEFMFSYCMSNGADVISCSWGTIDPNNPLGSRKAQAIARAAREGRNGKGCVVLFAAGNENAEQVNFYAALPDVIAVAACSSDDQHTEYSNRGMEVTVCAPSHAQTGWPVLAARASWDPGERGSAGEYRYWKDGRSRGNQYKHFGGTSASTPIVAGVCALMLAANPNLSAREVKEILIQTADKIGPSWEYVAGHSRKFGYGRVNAGNAVAEALRRRSPGPVSVPPAPVPGNANAGNTAALPRNGWSIQMGGFGSIENAQALTGRLKQQFSQPVFLHESSASGRRLFIVLMGNFATVKEASAFHVQIQRNGMNGFVKSFADLT